MSRKFLDSVLTEFEKRVQLAATSQPHMAEDLVNHPSHYTSGSIETIDYLESVLTEEEFRGFCKGNVLKYVSRERLKNGNQDLEKAAWYLNRLTSKKS